MLTLPEPPPRFLAAYDIAVWGGLVTTLVLKLVASFCCDGVAACFGMLALSFIKRQYIKRQYEDGCVLLTRRHDTYC